MPDIDATIINIYNDSVSQNATTSSLRLYRIGRNESPFVLFKFIDIFVI